MMILVITFYLNTASDNNQSFLSSQARISQQLFNQSLKTFYFSYEKIVIHKEKETKNRNHCDQFPFCLRHT